MSERLNIAMIFGNVRRSRIIGGPPPIQVTGKVLTFSLWNLSGGFYEYSLYDPNITANSIVEVVPSRYDIAIVQAAKIMPEADVTAGYVKLYCKNAPAADIDITINIHTGLSTTPAKGFFIASGADGKDGTDGTNGIDGVDGSDANLSAITPLTVDATTENETIGDTHTHKLGNVPLENVVSGSPVEYGALYNWYAATDSRNIANDGWHVPSSLEFETLINFVDAGNYNDETHGWVNAGGYLKEIGFEYWDDPNTGATNSVGFNARGAGIRLDTDGTFDLYGSASIKKIVQFWNNDYGFLGTDGFSTWIYFFESSAYSTVTGGYEISSPRKSGISIRLIKDSTTLSHGETGVYIGNDGKIYPTICIGTQEWLAANLNETKYRNGDWITGYDNGVYTPITNAAWAALTTEAMCYYDDNKEYGGGETPLESQIIKQHNLLEGLQGGDAGEDEFYHLTADEKTAVENLLANDKKDWVEFEFADVEAGTAKEYVLDIKALIGYTIDSAVLQTDDGTLTGVNVKIGATSVTGLSSVTVTTTITETAATAANVVVAGDKVTISITTGYTGTPTLIRGKLNLTRT